MDQQGLMGGMAPRPGAPPQGQPAPAPDQQQPPMSPAMNQAAPELQQEYNRFVGRAMQLIYTPEMTGKIVQMLQAGAKSTPPSGQDNSQGGQGGQDKASRAGNAKALATVTVMVIRRVVSAAETAGTKIGPDVLFHGGTEIFSLVAEISDKAGLSDYANDRDALEGAYFMAIDMYLKQAAQGGKIDKAAAQQQLQQLQQMSQSGDLDRVLRQLDEGDKGPPAANDNTAEAPPADEQEPAPEPSEPPPEEDKGIGPGMMPKRRMA